MKYDVHKGDIWEAGVHRLMCADIVNDDISALFRDDKVDMIITDPPYGVAYVENKAHFKGKDGESQISMDRVIENDQAQTEPEYAEFTRGWLSKITPYMASYNTAYIFNSDLMMCALRHGMKLAGLYYSQMIVWVKNTVIVGRKDYLPQHEVIAYGWFGRHKMHRGKDKSVLFYPKPNKSKLHPTMKPVGLMRKIILNSTQMGGVCFDAFGGSGSTLMACEHIKRKCLMTEIDPVYCDTILRRWAKLTGQEPRKVL